MIRWLARPAVLCALLAGLAACNAPRSGEVPGAMVEQDAFRITEVDVRAPIELGVSAAFSERIRAALIDASWRISPAGKPKRVTLLLSRYHLYRPGRVVVHDQSSHVEARALVVDRETGRSEALIEARGVVKRPVGASGRIESPVNRQVEEAGLADDLATDLIRQLHGDAALSAKARVSGDVRPPIPDPADGPLPPETEPPRPNWDHASEMRCLAIVAEALATTGREELPPHCRKLGYRLPGR